MLRARKFKKVRTLRQHSLSPLLQHPFFDEILGIHDDSYGDTPSYDHAYNPWTIQDG